MAVIAAAFARSADYRRGILLEDGWKSRKPSSGARNLKETQEEPLARSRRRAHATDVNDPEVPPGAHGHGPRRSATLAQQVAELLRWERHTPKTEQVHAPALPHKARRTLRRTSGCRSPSSPSGSGSKTRISPG